MLEKLNLKNGVGEKIRRHWGDQKSLSLRNGNLPEQLHHFEIKHSVNLPSDLADYFLAVDGMNLNETDNEGFLFFPLQEFKLIRNFHKESANFPDAHFYFVFADLLAGCGWYAIRLSPDESTENTILDVSWENPKLIAHSFTEFIELYFERHPRLYCGNEDIL